MSETAEFYLPARCDKGTIKENSQFRTYYDRLLESEKKKRQINVSPKSVVCFAKKNRCLISGRDLFTNNLFANSMF